MEKRLLIPIIVGLVIFAAFFLYAAVPTWVGEDVQLKLVPVDPTDILRGEYLTLRYDISTLDKNLNDTPFTSGENVYVSLSRDTPARALRYSHIKPEGLYIAGVYWDDWRGTIKFGTEQYFIPEGTGGAVNFRDGEYTALVKIDGRGNARVQKILKNGQEVAFNYDRNQRNYFG
jgi:uncharacterized membrane-anchored protein